jgi:serine/threonine protein kinase/Flp pilus assembly protein TadD
MIGETVYHYRILEKIGEGGMGVVYKAEDIKLRRTVALKFLSPTSVFHGSTRERIMKEARAAASLDHQNICAIHEVEELDDRLFIVMAYCEGKTLGRLVRDGRPRMEKTLNILIQIAAGLGAAHEHGIVHRDVKPANIIVSDKGRVKIMDFGLAKQSGAETMTMTMAGAGTLSYMSPEQVRGDRVDQRSDIWSLGVLAYEMLTGRRPFEGDYDASILYGIANEPHTPAIEIAPDIPREINTIIERSLAKSPDDRYGTMEEMRDDLVQARDLLFGEPETAMAVKRFFPGGRHIFGWKITSLLALSVSAVLLLFIIRYMIADEQRVPIEPDITERASGPEASSDADIFYEQGSALYKTGNQPKGIRLIEQALEVDPEHIDALKTLAVFYDWGGDSKKAAELIAKAKNIAKRKGSTIELMECSAIESKVLHMWDKAVKDFGELFDARPDKVGIPIEIGYILSKYIGDFDRALEQFDLFFRIDPENKSGRHGQAHNYTGTALLYSGDFKGAVEAYERYRDEVPDSPDPVTSMANANLYFGNYEEAYRLYSSLLALDDPGFTVHEGLGKTCMEIGRIREANEHLHRYLGSVSFRGHKVNGHLMLAWIYLMQRDGESFDREMDNIDEIDPESIQACWLRGVRSITLDEDIDAARGELIRMTALMEKPFAFDETSRHEHLRGLILLAEGRGTGAVEALDKAVRKSPREFFFFGKERIRVLLSAGKTQQATDRGLALARYNPNDPMLLMLLCEANFLCRDMVSAREYYSRALGSLAGADGDYLPLIEFRKEYAELEEN